VATATASLVAEKGARKNRLNHIHVSVEKVGGDGPHSIAPSSTRLAASQFLPGLINLSLFTQSTIIVGKVLDWTRA